jgi:hypothetical protein
MRRIRIRNDGQHGYATEVTDAETGERIENVSKIDLQLLPTNKPVQAMITVLPVEIDVIAQAKFRHACPYCGKPKEE